MFAILWFGCGFWYKLCIGVIGWGCGCLLRRLVVGYCCWCCVCLVITVGCAGCLLVDLLQCFRACVVDWLRCCFVFVYWFSV